MTDEQRAIKNMLDDRGIPPNDSLAIRVLVLCQEVDHLREQDDDDGS